MTSLRAFAALGVVFYHFDGSFGPATYGLRHFTEILDYGYLGVDFFFVLSGFIIYHVYREQLEQPSKEAVRSFLLARFARIYPLHLFILLLWLGGMALTLLVWPDQVAHGGFYQPENDLFSFMTNLLMIHAWGMHEGLTWNGPSWSISAEWFAYLLFPVLALAFRGMRSTATSIALACAAYIALQICIQSFGATNIREIGNGIAPLVRITSEFVIGMCTAHVFLRTAAIRISDTATDVLVALCVLAFLAIAHFGAADHTAVPLFALIIGLLARETGHSARMLSHPALLYLGHISYSIYMVHLPIRTLYVELAKPLIHDALARSYVLSVIATLVMVGLSLAAASLTYHYVENPARRFIRARSARAWHAAGDDFVMEAGEYSSDGTGRNR